MKYKVVIKETRYPKNEIIAIQVFEGNEVFCSISGNNKKQALERANLITNLLNNY